MKAIIRNATEADLKAAVHVFLTTLADLKRRHGAPRQDMDEADWAGGYEHVLKTGIFNVAEVDGQVIGVANGIVRDDLWFLTGFWILPEYQGKGIGHELIRDTWDLAEEAGAKKFFVWASIDLPALGNYMQLGMLPGYQIFTYKLSRETLDAAPGRTAGGAIVKADFVGDYKTVDLTAIKAGDIDAQIRGTRREIDHQYWLSDPDRVGQLVLYDDCPVGYFYTRKGTVGALAYLDIAHEQAVMDYAMQQALKQDESIVFIIPGINRTATNYIISLGARLVSTSHFLTSDDFGKLNLYLPSGPLLY